MADEYLMFKEEVLDKFKIHLKTWLYRQTYT